MKKVVIGSIKFEKPVIEKLIDVYYIVDENGEKLKHKFFMLTYEEMDKKVEELIEEIRAENPKLMVIDKSVSVNFGDEEIEKHFDTVIEYDEEWIKSKNPDREDFERWLISFVDELILPVRRRKKKC